jgi:hypothetical protein
MRDGQVYAAFWLPEDIGAEAKEIAEDERKGWSQYLRDLVIRDVKAKRRKRQKVG